MLKLIRDLLQKFIDDLDSGNTNISYEKQCQIIRVLSIIGDENEEFSKVEAADYVGLSVSSFEKRIEQGLIPKGTKVGRFKEHRWYKSDLNIYLINNKQ